MAADDDRKEAIHHYDDVAQANKLGVGVGEVVAHRITEEDLLRQSRESLTIYSKTGFRICLIMVSQDEECRLLGPSIADSSKDLYGFQPGRVWC